MKLIFLFSTLCFSIFCQKHTDDDFKWYSIKKIPFETWCHVKSYSLNHYFYMDLTENCKKELEKTQVEYKIDPLEIGKKRDADVSYDGKYTFWRNDFNDDFDVEVRYYDYGEIGFISIVFIEL
jgi:hypothetical protein